MDINDFLRVTKEVNNCPNCKNDRVGGEEGTLLVDQNILTRTCKCGFSFTYDVERGTQQKKVRAAIKEAHVTFIKSLEGRQVEFTGQVGATKNTFMVKGELYTRYITQLKLKDGRSVTVKDSSSPIDMMEAPTRNEAIKKGKEFLERVKAKREAEAS